MLELEESNSTLIYVSARHIIKIRDDDGGTSMIHFVGDKTPIYVKGSAKEIAAKVSNARLAEAAGLAQL